MGEVEDSFSLKKRGDELVEKKNYFQAAESYIEAIKLDRNNIAAWHELGSLYKFGDREYEANRCFEMEKKLLQEAAEKDRKLVVEKEVVKKDEHYADIEKIQGRGIKVYLVIKPVIPPEKEKDVHHQLFDLLPNYFSNIDINVYKRESESIILKVFAPTAKFKLTKGEVIPFYAKLIDRYLSSIYCRLLTMEYLLVGYQFNFVFRMMPPENEGELIPIPPAGSTSTFVPDMHISLDWVKQEEIRQPTHWIYKYVNHPHEIWFRQKALVLSKNRNYEYCIHCCVRGLICNPDSPYLLYLLGRTLGDAGNDVIGIKVLSRAIKLYPTFADSYIERGIIRARVGDINGSNKDYQDASAIEPGITIPKNP